MPRKFLSTLFHIARSGAKHSVWAVNVSPAGSLALLPCLRLISWIYRKPVVVRMFGGNLDEYIDSLNLLTRSFYLKTLQSTDVLALETQHLAKKLAYLGNVVQFPNTRNCSVTPIEKTHCKRFIFLSQVRREKGIAEILQAANALPEDVSIDVFGSIMEPDLEAQMAATDNVTYHGELQPSMVTTTLLQYDALLLPSYWQGEGHPGVIIEAFQCGLPVIATRWRQIPEVVSQHKDGILVSIKASEQLASAMTQLVQDHAFYQTLAQGAVDAGERFRSTRWHREFVGWCRHAANNKPPAKRIV